METLTSLSTQANDSLVSLEQALKKIRKTYKTSNLEVEYTLSEILRQHVKMLHLIEQRILGKQ